MAVALQQQAFSAGISQMDGVDSRRDKTTTRMKKEKNPRGKRAGKGVLRSESPRSPGGSLLGRLFHEKEAVIGVDVVPGCIRLCQMERHGAGWRIKKFASMKIEGADSIQNIRDNAALYAGKLKELVSSSGIKTKHAAVALPVASSIIKTLTLPHMTDAQIEQAIMLGSFWQNLQLSAKIKEYSVYHEVVKRAPEQNEMDILFVAARNSEIALYTDILTRADLQPVVMDIRCFALRNAFMMNASLLTQEDPAVLLKFGADENYILLIDRNEPYLYDIYLSDTERGTMQEQLHNPEFAQRFAAQVKQILSRHAVKHDGTPVQRIHLASAIKSVGGFLVALAENLQDYKISEYDFFAHVECPKELSLRMGGEENSTAWAVAMGLAARSLNIVSKPSEADRTDHVNLLLQAKSYAAEQRAKVISKLGVSAFVAAVVLAIVVMTGILYLQGRSRQAELVALAHVEGEYTQDKAKTDKLNTTVKNLETLEKMHKENPSNQSPLLDAYKRTSAAIPYGVWLDKMVFTPPNHLEMSGKAMDDQSILDFIRALDGSPEFSKVALKTMQAVHENAQSEMLKTFSLECLLAKMPEEKKKPEVKKTADKPAAREGSGGH